ncbi:MAG: hypothetical protein P1Q69_14290 [Candidatus Thorarchaeota archaeon]|nr:hypothetical protein [Candidatus Thorarchaeota archaeon]
MESYRKDMQRIIIAAILLAVIVASSILVAAYFSGQSGDSPEDGTLEFITTLPTAPLTLIVESGSQGTQIVGNLEFGFVDTSSGIAVGVTEDWLQIHNGFNKTDAVGLGIQEQRSYAFMYLDGERSFDYWSNRTPSDSITIEDEVAWSPGSRSSMYTGDIRNEDLSHLTIAGYVIEFDHLSVVFKDGSNVVCIPANLSLGVNFTLIDEEWQIDYILEASSPENVVFGSDSVTISLDYEIPDSDDDNIEYVSDEFAAIPDTSELVITFVAIPLGIGIVLVGYILFMVKRR